MARCAASAQLITLQAPQEARLSHLNNTLALALSLLTPRTVVYRRSIYKWRVESSSFITPSVSLLYNTTY